MRRLFQIRITSEEGMYEDCISFESLAEANEAYVAYHDFLTSCPYDEYHIEQIEVLQQQNIKQKEQSC